MILSKSPTQEILLSNLYLPHPPPLLEIQVLSFSSDFRGNHEKGADEEVESFVNLSDPGSQNAQCFVEELTGKEAQCNFLLLFLFWLFLP